MSWPAILKDKQAITKIIKNIYLQQIQNCIQQNYNNPHQQKKESNFQKTIKWPIITKNKQFGLKNNKAFFWGKSYSGESAQNKDNKETNN